MIIAYCNGLIVLSPGRALTNHHLTAVIFQQLLPLCTCAGDLLPASFPKLFDRKQWGSIHLHADNGGREGSLDTILIF